MWQSRPRVLDKMVTACLLLMAPGLTDRPLSLRECLSAACVDAARQPPEIRPHLRYLLLNNFDASERTTFGRVLAGHCNGLSRKTDITLPLRLASSNVLRINLLDYGWSQELWESLADSEPYFHGNLRRKGSRPKIPGKSVYLPGLPAEAVALATETGSNAAFMRADWFFNRTAAQADRKPGYYDFLGIKDQKDFEKAVGHSQKLHDSFGLVELREAVAISGVTLQPRGFVRYATLGGGYWKSIDFRNATEKRNPLRVLGSQIEEDFDASEQFGHLPNGFWAMGLFDRGGKRVDTAPDFVASDHESKSNDRRVHVNVSCLRCHSNGGLQDIDGWARGLFRAPLTLKSNDYEELKRLRAQYLRRLEPFLERDRAVFAMAVMEATGFSTKEYSAAYAQFWERYEDAKISMARAARELGSDDLRMQLESYVRTSQYPDPVLAALLQGRSVGIRQWEESYSTAYSAVRKEGER